MLVHQSVYFFFLKNGLNLSYKLWDSDILQHEVRSQFILRANGTSSGSSSMVILDALKTYYFKAGEYIHIIFTDAIISIDRAHIYVLYTP
jgi:hypothetical protein